VIQQRVAKLLAVCLTTATLVIFLPNGKAAGINEALTPHLDPHGPPSTPPDSTPADLFREANLEAFVSQFIAAAGQPRVEAELRFFADRVDYFGRANVLREEIRRELTDRLQWPQRDFEIIGPLEIVRIGSDRARVSFPLRYDFRSGQRHVSGKAKRTLVVAAASPDELEIVALNDHSFETSDSPRHRNP
jgi:hypothetical protein